MANTTPAAVTEVNIQFLDVGQGDGIYMEFPDKTNMLVDFGSTRNKELTSDDALLYLKNYTRFRKKNATLNYLVLTHGDLDHYNNVKTFVDELQPDIKNLLYGGQAGDYGKVITDLQTQYPSMTVLQPASQGPFDIGTFGDAYVRVLAINAPATSSDSAWLKNTGSVVLQITFGGNSVVLTGDATIDTEKYILDTFKQNKQTASLRSLVLKAQHHGSNRTSFRPSFISALKPGYVFISSDRSGTLGTGERSTGHRLPQEVALEVVRQNTTLKTEYDHYYFSSFDEDDFANYVNPDTRKWKPFTTTRTGREWLNPKTTEAIFTSLGELDKKYDSGPADEGVQYGITLYSDGKYDIASTA